MTTSWRADGTVAVHRGEARYPATPPFDPGEAYPELRGMGTDPAGNPTWDAVRETLRLLGLDGARFGTAEWNPLGALVRPGDTVVLKPNLIREGHLLRPDEWEQVITHPAVIRAVAEYAALALRGSGRLVICDGPQTDSDYDEILRRTGLRAVASAVSGRGVRVELLDLRRDRWFQRGEVTYKRVTLPGDPAGYTTVELGADSEFQHYGLSGRFYGADYDMAETATFHNRDRHAYVLCRTVMDADVVINLPKMKTHKKTGVTLSLKNMVGINGYRNCLPHHTIGTPDQQGDEFPTAGVKHKIESGAIVTFKKLLARLGGGGAWARGVKRVGRAVFGDTHSVVRSGNWHGNETAWRMVLDLNKCLFHFGGEGAPRTTPLRYLTLIDGILAGEGNGPQAPDTVPAGLLIAGFNPVAADTVCTTLMGFDPDKVPVLHGAWAARQRPLAAFGADQVRIHASVPEWSGTLADLADAEPLRFTPHFGWTGRIERTPADATAGTPA